MEDAWYFHRILFTHILAKCNGVKAKWHTIYVDFLGSSEHLPKAYRVFPAWGITRTSQEMLEQWNMASTALGVGDVGCQLHEVLDPILKDLTCGNVNTGGLLIQGCHQLKNIHCCSRFWRCRGSMRFEQICDRSCGGLPIHGCSSSLTPRHEQLQRENSIPKGVRQAWSQHPQLWWSKNQMFETTKH